MENNQQYKPVHIVLSTNTPSSAISYLRFEELPLYSPVDNSDIIQAESQMNKQQFNGLVNTLSKLNQVKVIPQWYDKIGGGSIMIDKEESNENIEKKISIDETSISFLEQ